MSIALLFWILMLFWLIVWLWLDYVPGQPYPVKRVPGSVLLFILLVILGWRVFGSAVHS